jgi:integrase
MPKPRKNERVPGTHFFWLLTRRSGYWRADGRSNRPNVGRHSLGTRDLAEARRLLVRLDLTMAVRHGLADPAALQPTGREVLTLAEGRRLYEEHIGRDEVVGGIRASSRKRYRAVFDKFLAFARQRGLTTWNQVTAKTLEAYAANLTAQKYEYRTRYLELTTLKQTVGWLVDDQHLPPTARIVLPLPKAQGTTTHCWRSQEAQAMIVHCRGQPDLEWLAGVMVALTFTGLRIGELVALRWSDIDLADPAATGMIRLADESTSAQSRRGAAPRTLKGGRGRAFPIHAELRQVLDRLPRHRDGYVFHGPLGGRLKADTVRRALIRDVLKPLAEKFPTVEGDVGFKDGRLHSFRHFFASLCANQNVPQRVVMTWLGHKDSKMVAHYYHLHDDEARQQMARLVLWKRAGEPELADGK